MQARNLLAGAEAQMTQANDALERYKMLHDNGSLPEVLWVEIQSKVARVRDVARVVREYDANSSRIEQDGHPCVLLSMEMKEGNNVVIYGEEVDKVLQQFREAPYRCARWPVSLRSGRRAASCTVPASVASP